MNTPLLRRLGLLVVAGLSIANSGATPAAGIDWPGFLARHDLVWTGTPSTWESGALQGNGLLGAMIYAEDGQSLRWDLGRTDVVDRGDRVVIGKFVLETGPLTQSDVRLDLWQAEARGSVRRPDGSELAWRSFTHATENVGVVEWRVTGGAAPSARFVHAPAVPTRETYRKEVIPESRKNPPPIMGETDGISWCAQAFSAGGGYVVAWTERETDPGSRALYHTIDYTSEGAPSAARAVATLAAAAKKTPDALTATHRAWWRDYYPRSFLSVPDTRLESFYWIQIYKLASATRADRPALDLMGPWFRTTPWPRIWWNLNIQLTYWPVYAANRLDLGESLLRLIDDNVQNLRENLPPDWRKDSAAIGRTSSYDARRAIDTESTKPREHGNLLWALHNYWLHYRHSGDEALLRDRLYPVLRLAVGYYLRILERGDDGRLHIPLSISPEYPVPAKDTNYDLALLRWGLQTLLATDARFGFGDPLAEKWRATQQALAPYPTDANGFMVGAGVPFDQSHRHYSHLFMFYPLHLLDPQSPADRPLLEKSLDHWLGLKPALRGYSFTGAAAMSAWLGRNNDIVPLLDQFLEFRPGKVATRFPSTANALYVEAGPVIETPLSAAATLHEILLQSWTTQPFGTHIRVFPAVPDAWSDARFERLLAQGGFEVSASRRDGRTRFVRVTSLAGAPCRISTGLPGRIIASGARAFTLTSEMENGRPVTAVDLRKGETVLLTSADQPLTQEDLVPTPVAAQPGRTNFYGSPKPDPAQ